MLSFSCEAVSDSLWPHGLQHARLPCPSLSTGVCSNSCPLSWWWYPTMSSSVIPFSSCLQSFPPSGSFPMSWLLASDGQSIGGSASVLPMNIQGWFPLGLTDLISLQSKGLSSLFSSTTVQKHHETINPGRLGCALLISLEPGASKVPDMYWGLNQCWLDWTGLNIISEEVWSENQKVNFKKWKQDFPSLCGQKLGRDRFGNR